MEAEAVSDRGSFRHWRKVIMIPALLATLAGFLISYAFPAKYTSQSLVLVEAPKIPDTVVQQVFNEDLTPHITTIQQRVLSPARLRPMVERLGLAKPGQNPDDVVTNIQLNMQIQPIITDLSQIGAGGKKKPGGSPVPGFYVSYTASTAREAQQICTDLTSMLLEEDLRSRQDASQGTTDFLTKQVADAKQNLNDLDKTLAAFKGQHIASSLSIEYDNARKVYQDDMAKLSNVKMATQAEQQGQGEQMALLDPATLPDSPDFPNRLLFAGGGLFAGLVFGIGLALWLKYRRATS
jgi:polysaccharide biosynthesis transport protein